MWELIKDILLCVIFSIIALWEFYRGLKKRSRIKMVFWLLVMGIILFLGIDQIVRDNNSKSKNNKRLELLERRAVADSLNAHSDSIKRVQFETALMKDYSIRWDSLTNKPIKTVYNTHIEQAEKVHIGPRN